ncbi:hypothetical protein GCM10027160_11540 [Streptomyces calidiresistens]
MRMECRVPDSVVPVTVPVVSIRPPLSDSGRPGSVDIGSGRRCQEGLSEAQRPPPKGPLGPGDGRCGKVVTEPSQALIR